MEFFIYAKSYRVDDALRSFSPKLRNCYFDGEKVLKYFNTYTKALCEFECNTNHTLKECGCVVFSMPREKDTPVCKGVQFNCAIRLETVQCECFSPCNDVRYTYRYDKVGYNRPFNDLPAK